MNTQSWIACLASDSMVFRMQIAFHRFQINETDEHPQCLFTIILTRMYFNNETLVEF